MQNALKFGGMSFQAAARASRAACSDLMHVSKADAAEALSPSRGPTVIVTAQCMRFVSANIALQSGFAKPVMNFITKLLPLQLSILPKGLTIATLEDGDI